MGKNPLECKPKSILKASEIYTSMDKEAAKKQIASLVEKYRDYESSGKLKNLGETDTRAIFIDPLFESLGWGIKNIEEVSREDRVSNGWVDYAFRISGVVRFFLEAKASNEELGEKEAWQAINYAYFKSVPWAVLTNFRKLVIYSSEWKTRKSEDSRFLTFDVGEYVERFDELRLLGSESIGKGEIDAFAEKVGKKAKREPVSRVLVEDLTGWRRMLGKNIRKFDPRKKFTKELLDEAVQRFLDRLIFIRTCEDRKFENERLRAAIREYPKSGRKLGGHINEIFLEFRDSYDSDIFFPHMAGDLTLDNEVLEQVVTEMYESPEGVPYNFAHIDADILGNVYEQYLAMMAREGGGLQEKEAKRKEMGIYYTPTYIVDYIVKNTLGEFISKAKNAGDLEKIRILDPACGSGSFLIRAYEELYRAYMRKNGGDNEMLGENMSKNAHSILTRNLYGVDLDLKAVEIAELNLLLKAAVRKGLLPPLSDNIKQGNSLISGSPEELEKYFGSDWERKKPFNWEIEFKEVMDNGGFDVVIGNPPWVRAKIACDEKELLYLEGKFRKYSVGELNLYKLFIIEGIQKLRKGGCFSFIVPSSYLSDRDSIEIRKWLLANYCVDSILLFSENATGEMFEGAITQATTIIIIRNETPTKNSSVKISPVIDRAADFRANSIQFYKVKQEFFLNLPDSQIPAGKTRVEMELIEKLALLEKLEGAIETRDGEVHLTKYASFISDQRGQQSALLVRGNHLSRYDVDLGLGERTGGWVNLKGLGIDSNIAKQERIVVQQVSNMAQWKRLKGGIIEPGIYVGNSCVQITCKKDGISLEFLLGILHSTLLNWYFRSFSSTNHVTGRELKNLPFAYPETTANESIVKLVKRRIALAGQVKKMGDMQTSERARLDEEIKRTDAEIDEIVYRVYGISDDEKRIIKESMERE